MKKILNTILAGAFMLFIAAPITAVAVPTQASAANEHCETSILGIPPWYRGMTDASCNIQAPDAFGGLSAFIWRIALNIIQIVLAIIAYIAFFFVIYGGFLFMTAGGNPSQVEKGRKSIFNAIIGLVIALSAIGITNFIFTLVTVGATNIGEIEGVVQMTGTDLIVAGLNLVYYIAGLVAVVMVIFGGFMYTASSGDPGRVGKAKQTLTWAIAGLIIILCAYAITNFIIARFM